MPDQLDVLVRSIDFRTTDVAKIERAHSSDEPNGDPVAIRYRRERTAHWDQLARAEWRTGPAKAYKRQLIRLYKFLIPKGQRVLEIGCGQGDLLAASEPSAGVGVDFSKEMLERARRNHPQLRFIEEDAHELSLDEVFDTILLSDVVNDLWDLQKVLQQIKRLSSPGTRVIMNFYSRAWGFPLWLAQRIGLARPNLSQNWLTIEDVSALLDLSDFEVIRHRQEILFPLAVPLLAAFFNRYLVKIWPLNMAALTHVVVARPRLSREVDAKKVLVSVIVPARNEAANIADIFARVPEMGAGTELIFVEGGSTDNTFEAIEQCIADHPERRCLLLKQSGVGKGDAVRLGFAHASGDALMILDSDLTVPPEDLPRFLDVLLSGKADFVNGSRLIYPMERQAMRFLNLIGNKFFSLAFSWLLEQPVKDTLCGTKVLWKVDYERIAANREYFGDFDPFGDFDLLFGAAKQNLKILDLPIRYRERVHGVTNIKRWRHGWLLLKMVAFAARRIKFV